MVYKLALMWFIVIFTVSATAQVNSNATKLVLSSIDLIEVPYPSVENLPISISLDTLTDGEVQKIRQDVYNTPTDVIDCMQWVFIRDGQIKSWRTIGALIQHTGIIKINGKFRQTTLLYNISTKRGFLGLQSPGNGLGKGVSYVNDFQIVNDFSEFISSVRTGADSSAGKLLRGELDAKFRTLNFAKTDQLVIENSKTECTYLKAKCRRYTFPLTSAEWVGYSGEKTTKEPIMVQSNLNLEMAIEDMCPYKHSAAVESSINSRLGQSYGVQRYGFPSNPTLKKALEPYMRETKP
jgi:hypothetical protein